VTVEEALQSGAAALPTREGIPEPRREASWLLAAAWGVDEITLRLHPEREVPADIEARYRSWLERRVAGEPAHHLTGSCPFWGREFLVTPEALVPRPETELLVQTALDLPLSRTARVLDVGTGSGCIAVSLAAERPQWRVCAVDRSPAALRVAGRNIERHGVEVELFLGDLARRPISGGSPRRSATTRQPPSTAVPTASIWCGLSSLICHACSGSAAAWSWRSERTKLMRWRTSPPAPGSPSPAGCATPEAANGLWCCSPGECPA